MGATVVHAVELGEQARDAIRGPARRLDTGSTGERDDLDARVLTGDLVGGRCMRSTVRRLDPRVGGERFAVLDRLVGRREQIDLPVGQRRAQLSELVLVARSEQQFHESNDGLTPRTRASWL